MFRFILFFMVVIYNIFVFGFVFLIVVKKIIILFCLILRGIIVIIFYKVLIFFEIVENVLKIFYKFLNVGIV